MKYWRNLMLTVLVCLMLAGMALLIISGALDPVGGAKSCPKVLEHYRKLGLRNVTLKLYENDRHEILNEDDREQVFRDLAEWFDGI